jgi:hypothetical protein
MEIVFVHLNTPIPKYLRRNLIVCIQRFPEHQVVLLHNEIVKPPSIQGLKTVELMPDRRWTELDYLYSHPKDFRGNFWLTSSTRLFTLEAYVKLTGMELVHIESDVILSKDFPFSIFHTLNKPLAFPLISGERGVASVVYIRNANAAEILASTLIREARKDSQATEMLSLRKVYDENRKDIQILPIGPQKVEAYRNIDNNIVQELLMAHEIFGGIFDGVEIGQFLAGTDPRNRRGKVLLRHDLVNGYADIDNWAFSFDVEREFVNLGVNGVSGYSKVFSLHMPVKEAKIFDNRSQSTALKKFVSESEVAPKTRTNLPILFYAILGAIYKRITLKKPD